MRTSPFQPSVFASETSFLARSGSYFGAGTPGFHRKSSWSNAEPGAPLPAFARLSIAFGSMAAWIAWRTLTFCVAGVLLVGPSGLPAHHDSGLPPVQVTVAPMFNRMGPPPWLISLNPGYLASLAVTTVKGVRRYAALKVPVLNASRVLSPPESLRLMLLNPSRRTGPPQ